MAVVESLIAMSARSTNDEIKLPDGPIADVLQSVRTKQSEFKSTVLHVVLSCNGILYGSTAVDVLTNTESNTVHAVMPFEKKMPKFLKRLAFHNMTVTMNNISDVHKLITLSKNVMTVVGGVAVALQLDLRIGKVEDVVHTDLLCDSITISKNWMQATAGTTLDVIRDIVGRHATVLTHAIEENDIERVKTVLQTKKDLGFTFMGVHTDCWSPKCAVCVKMCQVCEKERADVYCTTCDVYSSYQCHACWNQQHPQNDTTRTQVHKASCYQLPDNIVGAVFLKE